MQGAIRFLSVCSEMTYGIRELDSKSGAGLPVEGSSPLPSALTIDDNRCLTPCSARGFVIGGQETLGHRIAMQ